MTESSKKKDRDGIKLYLDDAADAREAIRLLKPMRIYVRFMVSLRCRGVVATQLEKLEIPYLNVDYGFVEIHERLSPGMEQLLALHLKKVGMELLSREKSVGLENMIRAIDALMATPRLGIALGDISYIASKAKVDSTEMIALFAEVKGISVKQFLLQQIIETAKVWLLYSEVNIQDLSVYFHFKNHQTFRREFKKFTGTPPLFYRKLKKLRALNAKIAGQLPLNISTHLQG